MIPQADNIHQYCVYLYESHLCNSYFLNKALTFQNLPHPLQFFSSFQSLIVLTQNVATLGTLTMHLKRECILLLREMFLYCQ